MHVKRRKNALSNNLHFFYHTLEGEKSLDEGWSFCSCFENCEGGKLRETRCNSFPLYQRAVC